MGAAWTFATPYNGIPDEVEHIVRAAGAGRGEIIPQRASAANGNGAYQHVKAGLRPNDPFCWQFHSSVSARCGAEPNGDSTLVYATTRAGRYPPAYYVVVGWPLALWPNWFGVYLARLIGAAIAAAFLACAAFAAVRWSRAPLMPLAVLVAVPPEVLHLTGGVNPNAIEIAAGAGLFMGLVTLLWEREPVAPRAALTLAGVSAATIIAIRPFGPVWILVALGVLFVPTTRVRLGRIFGNRCGRIWAAVLGAVFILSVLWTVVMRTGQPGYVDPTPMTTNQALRFELFYRLEFYAEQMIGNLSWIDTPLPALCYATWFMAFGLLAFSPFGVGGWRVRWRLGALVAISFALLIIPDSLGVRTYGLVSQGRYVLPLMVGVPILAAQTLGDRGALVGSHARGITRMLTVLLVPIQFIALYATMLRWQSGLGHYNGRIPPLVPVSALRGDWLPPLGPELPLVLGLLSVVLLISYGIIASRNEPTVDVPVPQQRQERVESDTPSAVLSPQP